jgi:hypothetical protein
MSWILFLAVLPPPHVADQDDHHPTLSKALEQLDENVAQLKNPALAAPERARLALEIRGTGERLPSLADGQPRIVKEQALDVEHKCAKLFDAATHNRPIDQPASQLSVSVHTLRSVIGP